MIILKTKQTMQTIVENNEHKIQEISNSNENNQIKKENNEIITEKEEVETKEFIEDSIYDSIYCAHSTRRALAYLKGQCHEIFIT